MITNRQNLIVIPRAVAGAGNQMPATGGGGSGVGLGGAGSGGGLKKDSAHKQLSSPTGPNSDVASLPQRDHSHKNNISDPLPQQQGKKTKMFRCELCSVRLPYSDQGMKDHMNCATHNRMKTLYEFGLWPGTESGAAAAPADTKAYKFTGSDGNIMCFPCGVVLSDSVALLQHQMQNHHWYFVEQKKLANLIPRIWYCEEEASKRVGKSPPSLPAKPSVQSEQAAKKGHSGSSGQKKRERKKKKAEELEALQAEVKAALESDAPRVTINKPTAFGTMIDPERMIKNVTSRLGKNFLVDCRMITPDTAWLNLPYMNFQVRELTMKLNILNKEFQKFMDECAASPGSFSFPKTIASKMKQNYTELKMRRDMELSKAKLLFVKDNPAVLRKLLERFGSDGSLDPSYEGSDDYLDESPLAKVNLEEPQFEPPVAPLLPNPGTQIDSNLSPSDILRGSHFSQFPTNKQRKNDSSLVSVSAAVDPDYLAAGLSLSNLENGESNSAGVVTSNSVMSNENSVSDVSPTLSTFDSMLLNLMKKAVNPEPKKAGFDIDAVVSALTEQEARRQASGQDLDPKKKLRTALLNQLIAERQQKSQNVDFMSQLLGKVIEKKQETMTGGPSASSHLDSWSGILDSVLKESKSRAEKEEVEERWNDPRMCFVWDGEDPKGKDCVMDVSEYHETLAVQQQAKEELFQEKVQHLIEPEEPAFFHERSMSPSQHSLVLENPPFVDNSVFFPSVFIPEEPSEMDSYRHRHREERHSKRRSPSPSRRERSRSRRKRSPSSPRRRGHSRDRHRHRRTPTPQRQRRWSRTPERHKRKRSPTPDSSRRSRERQERWTTRPEDSSIRPDCVEVNNDEDRVRRLFEDRRVVVVNRRDPGIPSLLDFPTPRPPVSRDVHPILEDQSLFEQAYVRERRQRPRSPRERRRERTSISPRRNPREKPLSAPRDEWLFEQAYR